MPRSNLVFLGAVLATFALWLLSFVAFVHPAVHMILVAAFLVGFALLAFRSYPAALLILIFEVVIGNKGSLFSIPVDDIAVGIRIALFCIIFLSWMLQFVRHRSWSGLRRIPFLRMWMLFLCVLAFGGIYGLVRVHSSLVYFDANGYVFYLLLLPLVPATFSDSWWKQLRAIVLGATTALAVITIMLSLTFTVFFPKGSAIESTTITQEQLDALSRNATGEGILAQTTARSTGKAILEADEAGGIGAVYRWLQDTGNGEISYIQQSFFRVFFASQFFLFLTCLWLIAHISRSRFFSAGNRTATMLVALHLIAMGISFSRSLWLAFIIGAIFMLFLLPREQRIRLLRWSGIATSLMAVLVFFAIPSVGRLFYERVASIFNPQHELASSTRLSLLPPILDRIRERPFFGWGFGTAVSFLAPIAGTDVVRTIQVYAFEWAYLDLAVKTGVIGLGVFLAFLGSMFRTTLQAWKRFRTTDLAAICAGVLFVLVTHVTTPYLNHPIGITAILLLALYATTQLRKTT